MLLRLRPWTLLGRQSPVSSLSFGHPTACRAPSQHGIRLAVTRQAFRLSQSDYYIIYHTQTCQCHTRWLVTALHLDQRGFILVAWRNLDKTWPIVMPEENVCMYHVWQKYDNQRMSVLTPSLPQNVKFMGWKMHTCTCKQCIFWSYTFSVMVWWKSFHIPVRKRR